MNSLLRSRMNQSCLKVQRPHQLRYEDSFCPFEERKKKPRLFWSGKWLSFLSCRCGADFATWVRYSFARSLPVKHFVNPFGIYSALAWSRRLTQKSSLGKAAATNAWQVLQALWSHLVGTVMLGILKEGPQIPEFLPRDYWVLESSVSF